MHQSARFQSMSAVDFVLEQFRAMVANSELGQGDLLPSESVLSERLGVSRGSVREAMKILSAFGIIEIKRGNGTYLSEHLGDSILDPLLLSLLIDSKDTRAMAEFREGIETSVVRLAVRHAEPDDVKALHTVIDSMKALLQEDDAAPEIRAEWGRADLAFHQALGAATHNPLMVKLYAFIMRFFESTIENTYAVPQNGQQAVPLHENILLAIEKKDQTAAAAAAVESIKAWERIYYEKETRHDR